MKQMIKLTKNGQTQYIQADQIVTIATGVGGCTHVHLATGMIADVGETPEEVYNLINGTKDKSSNGPRIQVTHMDPEEVRAKSDQRAAKEAKQWNEMALEKRSPIEEYTVKLGGAFGPTYDKDIPGVLQDMLAAELKEEAESTKKETQ